MNRTILIGILLLIVLAGAGYLFIGSDGEEGNDLTSEDSESTSLRNLIGSNQSVKCTFSSSVETGNSSGVVYIAGGKMRGDFTTTDTSTEAPIESHMIMDGEVQYMWSSAMAQGVKVDVSAYASGDTSVQAPVDYNAALNYDCDPWRADESVFEVPSAITFVDIGAYGNLGAPQGGGVEGDAGVESNTKVMQCQACDQLSGDQRTQCRLALGCQ